MKTHSSFQARVVQFGVWSLLSFIPCIGVANATAAPLLHDLNLLAATQHSQANAVSGNGKVVVGLAWDGANTPWIFRWTADGGTQDLDGGAIQGSANAVNATGTVIVGAIGSNASQRAFRWDAGSGLQDLGDLGGALTIAWGVNADGSVVVGQSDNVSAVRRAFRWTSALGMQDLGSLSVGGTSVASAVSGDGAVVVGSSASVNGARAFRWENGSMINLGTLAGSTSSGAFGVNADGSVVVGSSDLAAFRWTAASGMQDLGSLGGIMSSANGVSADGSVVVGTSTLADDSARAYRWTAGSGMTSLGLLTGGSYSEARGVSADGSVIVGIADNSLGDRAFIWKASGAGLAPIQDLDGLQTSVINSADTSANLLAMQAQRARFLLAQRCIPGAFELYCLSANGGVFSGETAKDDRQRTGLLGVGRRLDSSTSAGLNVAWANADIYRGDDAKDRTYGLGIWAAYQQHADSGTGWLADAGWSMSSGESRFRRGQDQADVQTASSEVAIKSTAQRVAVGYGLALGNGRVVPELALAHVQNRRGGFAERNVALPLQVQSARGEQTYATATLRGSLPMNAAVTLDSALALDVLLADDTPDFTGQSEIPGLDQFRLRSNLRHRSVVPGALIGGRYSLSPNASLSADVQARASMFSEQRPVYGVQFGYRYSF